MIEIMNINTVDKNIVDNFLKENEIDKKVIGKGKIYDLDSLEAFMFFEGLHPLGKNDPKGIAYYNIVDKDFEIVKIYTIVDEDRAKNILMEKLKEKAKLEGCEKIWSFVTNDKISTIEYLQRNGFEMKEFHENIIENLRKKDNSVYEFGLNGIKISHGLEFQMDLKED